MLATRSHVRTSLLSCARRGAVAGLVVAPPRTRSYAISPPNPSIADLPEPTDELGLKLREQGGWNFYRGRRKGGNKDKYRVNVTSEALCDDILNYIKPTLQRHEGCDLIDVFPGAGVWSRKLHDLLKPRSHLLLEPDEAFYKPFLEPLLQRPGTKLLPESGIVWEQLNKILSPEYLPHQVERRYRPDETPQRNDTLLVNINLSMHPTRKFRSFDSLVQLVLFQMISSIRPGALFQKYGLVRMLIWVPDYEKLGLVPRTLQRRKKMSIEAEISTDWVCEVAGSDYVETMGNRWHRDASMDLESTRRTLERMRQAGFAIPAGREPQHVLNCLDLQSKGLMWDSFGADQPTYIVERPSTTELAELEAKKERGELERDTRDFKRHRTLKYWQQWTSKRGTVVQTLLQDLESIMQAFADAEANSDPEARARADQRSEDWCARVKILDKNMRHEVIIHRDNLRALAQDPPVLGWDRRYVEPLRVRADEFFPAVPCSLIDVQPKAAARVFREIGPNSTRGGDMFDLILRSLLGRSSDPISRSIDSLYGGAGEGIRPHCPSLTDLNRGGSPMRGIGEINSRSLSEEQLVEIAEAWMKWPFRPSYAELVSSSVDEAAEDTEDAVSGNNMVVVD